MGKIRRILSLNERGSFDVIITSIILQKISDEIFAEEQKRGILVF